MIDEKLGIKYNPNSDSSYAEKEPNLEEMVDACVTHNKNISSVLYTLANSIKKRGDKHDWSIMTSLDEYTEAYIASLRGANEFENSEYFLQHALLENHHLDKIHNENTNLFDVIEYIVDRSVISKERNDPSKTIELDPQILIEAFNNTIKQINDNLYVTL